MAATPQLITYLAGLGLSDAQIQALLASAGGTDGNLDEQTIIAGAMRMLAAGAQNAPTVTNPGPPSGGGSGTGSGGSAGGGGSIGGTPPPVTAPPPAVPAPAPSPGVSGTPFYRGPNGQPISPQDLVNSAAPGGNAQAMVNAFQFGQTPSADPSASPTWFSNAAGDQSGWSSAMDPHFGPYASADLNMQAAINQMAHGVYAPNAGMDIPLPSEGGGTGEAHNAVKAYYDTLGSRGLLSGTNTLMQVYGPTAGQQGAFADTPVASGGLGQTPEQIAAAAAAYYAKQGLAAQPQQGIAPYTGGGAPAAAVGPQPVPIGGGMYGAPPPPAPPVMPGQQQGQNFGQSSGQSAAPVAANPYASAIAKNQQYVSTLTAAQQKGALSASQKASLAAAQAKIKDYSTRGGG